MTTRCSLAAPDLDRPGRVTAVVPSNGVSVVAWAPPTLPVAPSVRARFKTSTNVKVDTTFDLFLSASANLPVAMTAAPAVVSPDTNTVHWSGGLHRRDSRVRGAHFRSLHPMAPGSGLHDETGRATAPGPAPARSTHDGHHHGRRPSDPGGEKLELPIQVSQSTSFQVPADAEVSIRMGDETFGPTRPAQRNRRVRPPPRPQGHEVLTGKLLLVLSREVIALPNNPEPVALFAPIPSPGSVGPCSDPIPLATASGHPPGTEPPKGELTSSAGALETTLDADGWTISRWTPPDAVGTVSFTASAGGLEARTSAEVVRGLLDVDAQVTPSQLTGNQRDVTFTGSALGADNGPVADIIGVRTPNGSVVSRAARRGTTTTFKARRKPDHDTVVVAAEPPGSVAAQPVQAVVPWLVPVDDNSILLRIAVVDPLGRAIVDVPVSLSLSVGEAEGLPDSVTTDGYGMATVLLPRPEATTGIRAAAQGHHASVVWTAGQQSVFAGDATWLALAADWQKAAPTFVVKTATAPPPAAIASAPSASSTSSAEPDASKTAAAPSKPPRTGAAVVPARMRAGLSLQGSVYSQVVASSSPTAGPLTVTVDDGVNLGGVQAYALRWLNDGPLGLELDARYLRGELTTNQVFAGSELELDPEDVDPNASPEDLLETLTSGAAATDYDVADIDIRAGLRFKKPIGGPLTAFGLAQGHYQAARLYLWDDGEVEPSRSVDWSAAGAG